MERWALCHTINVTNYFNELVKANKITGTDGCYENGYYICHDTWDMHIYRIQVGINAEYEEEERTKIIEQENIRKDTLAEYCVEKYGLSPSIFSHDKRNFVNILLRKIGIKEVLKSIVEIDYENGFETYDVQEFRYDTPIEELIEVIDSGWGITEIEIGE